MTLPVAECLRVDAADFAPELATWGVVDAQITDPPYSERVHASTSSMGSGGDGPRPRPLGFGAITPELRAAIMTLAAAIPRWTVVHSDFEGLAAWQAAAARHKVQYVRLVPWVRWSQPQLSGDRPGSQAEAVLHFHAKGAKSWNGPGSLMCYDRHDAAAMRGARKHPTEKPLDLALSLVSWFSAPREVVADLCAGHGTTGLAARMLGRGYVLGESDPEFHREAARRTADGALLAARDAERARRWVLATRAEAEPVAAVPPSETNRNTIARAKARLADAARVAEYLAERNWEVTP